MKSWEELPDKGPQIQEPDHRHKKGVGKKPFAIEWRYIGPRQFWHKVLDRSWRPYRRYKTQKSRDQAIVTLNHKRKNSHKVFLYWEYRIKVT